MIQTRCGKGPAAVMILAAVLLVFGGIDGRQAGATESSRPAGTTQSWTRTLEPASLKGAALGDLTGAPLDDLYVYSFVGGTWAQVPFQFDEVDDAGSYTVVNGLLDAVDELTFMASDLGEQATPELWIEDAESRGFPRYEVSVTNPLNPAEVGWLYVYRSPTLTPAYLDYVQWDGANYRIEGGTYTVGMNPEVMAGISTLELNGSEVDVLDRMKIRIEATCHIGPLPISVTLNEEDLAQYGALVPNIDGAVRVGGGTTSAAIWFYRSAYRMGAIFDLGSFDPPQPCTELTIDALRESTDWLDPAASGMAPATYYDDNTPDGVAVDGVPDSVPALPLVAWSQVSGGRGSVVTAIDVSLGDGTVSNYYLDDSTPDSGDTGDQRSYGDTGFVVDSPGGSVDVDSASYILDALQPNLGALYRSYQSNPLVTAATAQAWQPACEPVSETDFSWTPAVPVAGEPVSLVATASGTQPITYAWDLGDGTTGSGATVIHTYSVVGFYNVLLTASNACGQQNVEKVVSVGQRYLLFLPEVLSDAP